MKRRWRSCWRLWWQRRTLKLIGSRPPMVRDTRYDSVHIFGALCPARGIGADIIMPDVNTEAMNEPLKEISCQVAPSVHALLVYDGAGWHQSGERLIVPSNITLLACRPTRRNLTRWKTSGTTCAATNQAAWSVIATRQCATPAKKHGISSPMIRTKSSPSEQEPARVSMAKSLGIMGRAYAAGRNS